jgi:hypothetical protein
VDYIEMPWYEIKNIPNIGSYHVQIGCSGNIRHPAAGVKPARKGWLEGINASTRTASVRFIGGKLLYEIPWDDLTNGPKLQKNQKALFFRGPHYGKEGRYTVFTRGPAPTYRMKSDGDKKPFLITSNLNDIFENTVVIHKDR